MSQNLSDNINIAMKYTNGDVELAKNVVRGNFQDILVVKSRFKGTENSNFGNIIIFLATQLNEIVGLNVCTGNSASIYNNKPFDPWKSFEEDLTTNFNSEPDQKSSKQLKEIILSSIESSSNTNFIEVSQKSDYDTVTTFLQNIISENLHDNILCQVEFEKTNSIIFESTCKSKIITESNDEEVQSGTEEKYIQSSNPFAGNVILIGKAVLSPVRGKDINSIQLGDNIKVLIQEKTQKAINIATKLNAYENGEMKSIIAEVESYKKNGSTHEIYASIAPYILVKITEEEDVKVSYVTSVYEEEREKYNNKNYIIGLAIIIVVLVSIVIFLFSK